MSAPDFIQPLDHGITVIDTGFHRPNFDAAYLLISDGRAAFIDTGHNAGVPRLLAALAFHGLGVEAVDWVIPTHVHLDHAGGAGLLMQQLPNARALIHPRGARHLINPVALIKGAQAVYGAEEVARTYGEIQPIPAERVLESHDEMTVQLGSRPLRLIDSPGHARHHHCIWDATSRGWFTGDTFGISYREFDGPQGPDSAYILPSSTPVQFDPQAMRASIERMLQTEPQWIYPTHYGRLGNVPDLAAQLFDQLEVLEHYALAWARANPGATDAQREAAMIELMRNILLTAANRAGSMLPLLLAEALLETDIRLNGQGLAIWLASQPTADTPAVP
ncbi:beta-lactamase domain protein [Leptothrix cholodnii SP-6]|uniref:Beta-lactamase domain protein n=1 Tax=Leptothrix cholodnii (strain ATCC 51168 / LMG 8142 / SP-6) TaxID=395495 RepID=B1XXD5_LEPCP|nr:MBL fold metallo-hydrolase [Leptothrix cholodnii]ACB33916.1 beta-lactamase domain protein [Leptothrix cholodnii SP-6]